MSGIGSLIREIDVKNQKIEKANRLLLSKTKACEINIMIKMIMACIRVWVYQHIVQLVGLYIILSLYLSHWLIN